MDDSVLLALAADARTGALESVIDDARRRARRRRGIYGAAAALAAIALGLGLFFLLGGGDAGSGKQPGGGASGAHGSGGSSAGQFAPGTIRFLKTVTLPPSRVPAFVRRAFAARRYSSAPPREAARLGSSVVLWASPAYGGGWCEGLEQPHSRFDRLSVSCTWPKAWMRRRIPFSAWGNGLQLLAGRVPQRSVRELRLRLSDRSTLVLPIRDGFFLYRVPDRVLVHAGPQALSAYDSRGRLVAREKTGSPLVDELVVPFRGIVRPPGGAELRHKHKLLGQRTTLGQAAIWAAPDFAVPGSCTWLQIGRAAYGGDCRRSRRQRHGLSTAVPLRLPIRGRILNLLWGEVGADVASLAIRFQDGSATRLPVRRGVFLYPVPGSRWAVGRRPAWLIARDSDGRTLGKRLLVEFTLAR
jgi:hypothetical protein